MRKCCAHSICYTLHTLAVPEQLSHGTLRSPKVHEKSVAAAKIRHTYKQRAKETQNHQETGRKRSFQGPYPRTFRGYGVRVRGYGRFSPPSGDRQWQKAATMYPRVAENLQNGCHIPPTWSAKATPKSHALQKYEMRAAHSIYYTL